MPTRPVETLQARATVRRREILDAALACFNEKGMDGIAIEDLCSRSGASVSSVYHLFGNKAGVAAALYLDALAAFQEAVSKTLKPSMGARQGLGAFIAAHIRWADKHRTRSSYLLEARHTEGVAAHTEDIRALNRSFAQAIAHWARPHFVSGQLRALPLDLFVAQLLGPTHEYVRGRLSGRSTTAVKAAIDQLGEAAWRALGNGLAPKEPRSKGDHK